MDKQTKLVIVGLVILALLFVLGLGTALIPKQDGQQAEESARKGWIRSLDGLTAGFKPSLDRSRLTPAAACRQKAGGFEFNRDGMQCDIAIGPAGDRYQSGTLVISNAARILVPCSKENDTGTTSSRGVVPERLSARPPGIRPRPGQPTTGTAPSGGQGAPVSTSLDVIYTPQGEDSRKADCVADRNNEVRLVVLRAGGMLRLRCDHCSDSQVVRVGLKP